MPGVVARRHDERLEPAQGRGRVEVREPGEHDADHAEHEPRGRREAEQRERRERDRRVQRGLERVLAIAAQPVHRDRRVVDAMDAPQHRDGVHRAMDRIERELGRRDDHDELEPQWLRGHQVPRVPGREHRERGVGRGLNRGRGQRVRDHHVGEVGREARADDRLHAAQRCALPRGECRCERGERDEVDHECHRAHPTLAVTRNDGCARWRRANRVPRR